jgi:hypothetical protein
MGMSDMQKPLIKIGNREVTDRRTIPDRRKKVSTTYIGIERRKMMPRRNLEVVTCIYCGRICGSQDDLSQAASTIETTVECRAGICIDCSTKRFPQFYADD